jgi:hypothetical protein
MDVMTQAQEWSEKEGKGIVLDFRKNLTAARKKGQKLYFYLKFWADCWEAFWMAVSYERKLWDEDMKDLSRFFRQLLVLKYRKIMHLTMNNLVHYTFEMNPAISPEERYNNNIILEGNKLFDTEFRQRAGVQETNEKCGHLIIYPERSNDQVDEREITRFGIVETDAAAELLFGIWAGWDGKS